MKPLTQYKKTLQVYLQVFDICTNGYPADVPTIVVTLPILNAAAVAHHRGVNAVN
jgi:hypothetical protein